MSWEPVDVFVKDTTPAKAPVSGVVVKVFSPDGKFVYGMQTTDVTGRAAFLLPAGFDFSMRFYRFSVAFTQPQLFTVLPSPAINVFDVPATFVTPPVPNDARLCTAFGFFRDVTGAPQANVEIHFVAKFNPVWLEGAAVVKERVIIRTDVKGYAQVNLIRNGQYDCTVQGEEDVLRQVAVPDAPNVNIADLIFPVVNRVTTKPVGPFTLAKGATLAVEMHIFSSDGNDLGKAYGDVMYRSSDQDVLGFSFDATHIILQGVKAGSASVLITRADRSIVRIPDAPLAPLMVVVTP